MDRGVYLVEVSLGLLDEGADLGAFVGDRRTLGVVLVIGDVGLGGLDDLGELPAETSDPLDLVGPVRRQLRRVGGRLGAHVPIVLRIGSAGGISGAPHPGHGVMPPRPLTRAQGGLDMPVSGAWRRLPWRTRISRETRDSDQ